MEMKISVSVAMAINFMMNLIEGRLAYKSPELERPYWSNFLFFNRIISIPIRKKERVNPKNEKLAGLWILEREVEFYVRDTLVARVHMIGKKLDRLPDCPNRQTFWGFQEVEFLTQLNTGISGQWIKVAMEPGVSFIPPY